MKEDLTAPLRSAEPAALNCDYCGKPAEQATGADIYPHRPDLKGKRFFRCVPCGAYVGCHARNGRPLGRLANASLRAAKMRAHAAFDPIWKSGDMSRKEAYAWLAQSLGISADECHVGMFDLNQCAKVVEACAAYGKALT